MDDLARAVHAVVHECLAVKAGEEALVVCNPATQKIGERLREAAAEAGADAALTTITERRSHGAEPPRTVAEAMAAADVVIAPTIQSLSHTAARKRANEEGARIATLPGVTEEMLARVMTADMDGLRRKGNAVAEALDRAGEARITDANGTDLRLDLSGREAIPDAGEITQPGAFGNLPCGEGFIAPAGGEGALAIDGPLAGIGLAAGPLGPRRREADAAGRRAELLGGPQREGDRDARGHTGGLCPRAQPTLRHRAQPLRLHDRRGGGAARRRPDRGGARGAQRDRPPSLPRPASPCRRAGCLPVGLAGGGQA